MILKTNILINKNIINRKLKLMLVHEDCTKSIGGIQKYVCEQSDSLIEQGVDVAYIFPCYINIYNYNINLYGVYLNNKFIGCYLFNYIIDMLINNIKLDEVFIHSLKGWNEGDYNKLLNRVNERQVKKTMFIHDLYYITPSLESVYNNKVKNYYNIGDNFLIKDNISLIELKNWQKKFENLFHNSKIVVPSEYFSRVVSNNLDVKKNNIDIIPHLKLELKSIRNTNEDNIIRIAYLGYKAEYKGWSTWLSVLDKCKKNKYKYLHIGSNQNKKDELCEYISYCSKGKKGINTATNILIDRKVDIVILWSLLPESYSYTFYEAIAAGCYIITFKNSGNIAYEINRLGENYGMILDDEKQLIDLINNTELLLGLIKKYKREVYELKFNINS
jgi:Glycosyltransferase